MLNTDQYGNKPRYGNNRGINNNYSQPTHLKLQQSHSLPATNAMSTANDINTGLGSLLHDTLDDFQVQLFQFLNNASDDNVRDYFQKKISSLERFILSLYIKSIINALICVLNFKKLSLS